MKGNITAKEKITALYQVTMYRPKLTAGLILLSVAAAILEGLGLGFILPIIEHTNSAGSETASGGAMALFVRAYSILEIPFTLEYIVLGVSLVMVIRYTASFLVGWLRSVLRTDYVRALQTRAFNNALKARVEYFDTQGSDEILNAIVTQSTYAGRAIERIIRIFEQVLLSIMYISIALYLAPVLTIATGIVLGGLMYLIRAVLESGYEVGNRTADANEAVQEAVQAGTQGIRDVKLFGMSDEMFSQFKRGVDKFANSIIRLRRNNTAIKNFTELTTAVTVFVLIYLALTFSSLTLGNLGVFLFAMFRLGPRLSRLNDQLYQAQGDLPHLIRTQKFIEELKQNREIDGGSQQLPNKASRITFEDVSFSYSPSEQILDNISFSVSHNKFVAFVGPSGAGKSTIVSLLTRMYEPDEGRIIADGTDITCFPLDEWRSRVSVVQQNPFIFNDTLRYNVSIGNRQASNKEIKQVCEISRVTEFLDDLPNGYQTNLGDDGVRLSGGQRQRIAIARALLKETDVLVLDEATSDLDTKLEKKVHDGIESMDRNFMMIVIAHRLSTVTNADSIYALEDGNISERGPHKELLEKEGSYADLYKTQTKDV